MLDDVGTVSKWVCDIFCFERLNPVFWSLDNVECSKEVMEMVRLVKDNINIMLLLAEASL